MWPFRRTRSLGRRGEEMARRYLKRAGLKILARNYRCPSGEVDLIALAAATGDSCGAETIVFVEVKTRSDDRYTAPESAVNAQKRRRLEKAADHYLAGRDTGQFNVRFDIVSVVVPPGGKPRIEHIPRAF